MPAFLDPEHFTVRAGPEAIQFGDEWRSCCSVTIQHDRRVYMYAIASNVVNAQAVRDMKDMIRAVREVARLYGWVEILWHRERGGKTHIAHIPINQGKTTHNASNT
jgi:hypothetical protein